MTDVSNKETTPIHTFKDAASLYAPSPTSMTGKVGIESERHVYRVGLYGPEMIEPAEMMEIQEKLKRQGLNAQLEAASVLEYASPAFAVGEMSKLLQKTSSDRRTFDDVLQKRDIYQSNYAVMPTMTVEDALSKMIDRERLRVGIKALADVSAHGATAVALLTAGVQVSFSPKDNEQLFRMAYRAYALTPLLFAAMDSHSGFVEGDPKRRDYQVRGDYYLGYDAAGGIAESFLTSVSGESYINHHIQQVFKTPMYFAYGNDALIPSTKGKIVTFDGLPKELQTRANYELAESFLYHDVKICNLRDDDGTVVGKRLEVRAADSGEHQAQTAPLIIGALVPDGATGDAFDGLLRHYGFTGNPVRDAGLFRQARRNAVYHSGKFMDVAFGKDPKTGRQASLLDFAYDVSGLLGRHYASSFGDDVLGNAYEKATYILETGESSAYLNAGKFKSINDVCASLVDPARPRKQRCLSLSQRQMDMAYDG